MFRTKKSEASKKSLKSGSNGKKQQLADYLSLPQEFQTKDSLKQIFRLYLSDLNEEKLNEDESFGTNAASVLFLTVRISL